MKVHHMFQTILPIMVLLSLQAQAFDLDRSGRCDPGFNLVSIEGCDSILHDSVWHYQSVDLYDTLTILAANGCDSINVFQISVFEITHDTLDVTSCDSFTWSANQITFYENGVHVDTFSNVGGCDSIVTLNLSINESTSTTDSIEACVEYTWINNVTYVSSNYTASYIATASNGCDSVVYLKLTLDTVDIDVVANSQTMTAQATNATFQWLECNFGMAPINGATSATYTPNINGFYAVEVTQNGCVDTSDCFHINGVGVGGVDPMDQITVYPNPTRGKVLVNLEGLDVSTMTIYNTLGQRVQQIIPTSGNLFEFQLEGPEGMYFIQFESGTNMTIIPIIKQ